MKEVNKYYVWKNNERFTEEAFNDIDEAISFAKENNCDEVEETVWSSEESYNNYEPADKFKTIWHKQ